MRKCVVQLRCNATILNEFSQSLEGKKISFVIACQSAHRTEVLKKITTRLGFFNSGKNKASFQISGKRPDCNELTIFVRTGRRYSHLLTSVDGIGLRGHDLRAEFWISCLTSRTDSIVKVANDDTVSS